MGEKKVELSTNIISLNSTKATRASQGKNKTAKKLGKNKTFYKKRKFLEMFRFWHINGF